MGIFALFQKLGRMQRQDSSLLPFAEALDVVADFGGCVAQLNNPQRIKAEGSQSLPLSLPSNCLPHSKEKIQMALAVVIAGLTVELSIGTSPLMKRRLAQVRAIQGGDSANERDQIEGLIHTMWASSGDLVWFTCKPVFLPINADSVFGKGWKDSQSVFAQWAKDCEVVFHEKVGERLRSRNKEWPSLLKIAEYWRDVDRRTIDLLKSDALIAIRAT